MNEFGILLTRLRVDRKLNYTQLGNKAGYDRKSIKQWENGIIYPPNDQTIRNLCQALDANKSESRMLFDTAYKFHLLLAESRYPTRKTISRCKDPKSQLPAQMQSEMRLSLKLPEH